MLCFIVTCAMCSVCVRSYALLCLVVLNSQFTFLNRLRMGRICLKYGTRVSPTISPDTTRCCRAFSVAQITCLFLVFRASDTGKERQSGCASWLITSGFSGTICTLNVWFLFRVVRNLPKQISVKLGGLSEVGAQQWHTSKNPAEGSKVQQGWNITDVEIQRNRKTT